MSKANPGVRGKYLERLIMDAKNLKCVFLSGTPMINNLFEISKLFNLLRGYIITYNFNLKPTTSSPKQMYGKLNTILKDHPLVDQYFINEKDHFIRLTKNPDGFISQSGGLIKQDKVNIEGTMIETNLNHEDFVDMMMRLFGRHGFRPII